MAKGRVITDPLTGQQLTFLETAADTAGRSLRAEVRLGPKGFVPRHAHLRQHERLEVRPARHMEQMMRAIFALVVPCDLSASSRAAAVTRSSLPRLGRP